MSPSVTLILRDLAIGPAAVIDLLPILGLGERIVQMHLRHAHEVGLVHICGWERGKRRVWAIGPGRDARRIPLSGTEKNRRWRAKVRGNR